MLSAARVHATAEQAPSQADLEAMTRACSHLKGGSEAHRRCLLGQERALRDAGNAPSLAGLSDADRGIVRQACRHLAEAGPGHYYACLRREEQALLAAVPSLEEVPPSDRLEVRVACSRAAGDGPWSHNQCLAAQAAAASASETLLKGLRKEERIRVSNACATQRTSGLTSYHACLKAKLRTR